MMEKHKHSDIVNDFETPHAATVRLGEGIDKLTGELAAAVERIKYLETKMQELEPRLVRLELPDWLRPKI